MKTITFKSTPENYRAESLDWKRCTVREKDPHSTDIRFEIMDDWIDGNITDLSVDITCARTAEYCTKKVTHVSKLERLYIICW